MVSDCTPCLVIGSLGPSALHVVSAAWWPPGLSPHIYGLFVMAGPLMLGSNLVALADLVVEAIAIPSLTSLAARLLWDSVKDFCDSDCRR